MESGSGKVSGVRDSSFIKDGQHKLSPRLFQNLFVLYIL